MSDLSIEYEKATPVNTPRLKPAVSKANSNDLPPLNIKSASERRKYFGKVKRTASLFFQSVLYDMSKP